MNDFEKILRNATEEELDDLKLWLFRENIRMQAERIEMDKLYSKFEIERKQFQAEMKLLNKKIQTKRKRLQQDEIFFDKKRKILENGFYQLDGDRRKLNMDKQSFENSRKHLEPPSYAALSYGGSVKNFFNGVTNTLTLKKRYKDLLKIFHPDNVSGDNSTVQLINTEYNDLKRFFSKK